MTEFSLTKLVNDVCQTSDSDDLHMMAKEVLRRIDEETALEALEQALPMVVRLCCARSRNRNWTAPPAGAKQKHVPSQKVAAVQEIGEQWRKTLDQRWSVAPGEYKKLRECTVANLRYIARGQHAQAQAAARRERAFESLADVLVLHQAATVADVPENVLRHVITKGTVPA